jgi:hypothetical protein
MKRSSTFNPSRNGPLRYSYGSSKALGSKCFSIPFYVNCISTVALLCLYGNPSAISWLISSKRINSIKSEIFGKPTAHVLKESEKVIPSRTDAYPSVKIEPSVRTCWRASITHSLPSPIDRQRVHSEPLLFCKPCGKNVFWDSIFSLHIESTVRLRLGFRAVGSCFWTRLFTLHS